MHNNQIIIMKKRIKKKIVILYKIIINQIQYKHHLEQSLILKHLQIKLLKENLLIN